MTETYTKADTSEVNHKSFTAGSGQIVMHLDRTLQDFYVAEISQVIQQSEHQTYWDSKVSLWDHCLPDQRGDAISTTGGLPQVFKNYLQWSLSMNNHDSRYHPPEDLLNTWTLRKISKTHCCHLIPECHLSYRASP